MTNQHPITPPPELVQQLQDAALFDGDEQQSYERRLITAAYRAGADQELEACRLWVSENHSIYDAKELKLARRPKPLSLKEQALQAWAAVMAGTDDHADMAVIRRALEALPE